MKVISKFTVLFFCLLSLLLSGCYDAREVDDEIYAISIGLDKGVNNKLRLTIQYPTYGSDSNSSSGGSYTSNSTKETSAIQIVECPSFIEGLDMMDMGLSRRVSLMHGKMVVFSEELVKEGVGIYISAMQRFREWRSTMAVVVVKGVTAEEFIKENRSNIGGTISKSTEIMFLQAKYSNYFPYIKFRDFYRNIISPYQQAIAIYGGVNHFDNFRKDKVKNPPLVTRQGFKPGDIPREGTSKREYAGVAVFNGDKMVGSLDSYETTYYLMIMGKFPKGAITFEDPDKPDKAIVLDFRNSRKTKVKAKIVDGKPVINLEVKLEGDIQAIQTRVNYENTNGLRRLDDYVAGIIEEDMKKLIEKTQKEYKSDIFGFGRYIAGKFSTIQEFEKFNWLEHYGEAEINVKADVEIRRTGTMLRSTQITDGNTLFEKGDKTE